MIARAGAGQGPSADVAVAVSAALASGAGTMVALAGAAMGDPAVVIGGGAIAAAGVTALMTLGWVDRLMPLALALPLPALYSTDAARLSPAVLLTALVLLAWALARGVDPRPLRTGALPVRSAAALLAAIAVAAAFAEYTLPAARELVTFVMLLGLLVVATHELGEAPGGVARLARALAVMAGIVGALAALQAAGAVPGEFPLWGTPFYRANLGFGGPTELAMFLAIALPFTVYAWQVSRTAAGRAAAGAGVVAAVLGLAGTFTRGSWFAVLAATLVLLALPRRGAVVRIWAGAAAAAIAVTAASGGVVLDRIADLAGDWVVEQRAAVMLAGVLMFLENPLVGVGPGGFGQHLERLGVQVDWLWDYGTSAHNAYVHMAAEAGALGLAALLAFLFSVLLALVRHARAASPSTGPAGDEARLRFAVLWAFATACMVSFVEWSFAHGIGQLVMLVAAMGLARPVRAGTAAPP